MNQILMVENNKKKKTKKQRGSSGPVEIKNIIRFFAVVIIVFGLFLIGHSSYGLYVNSKGTSTEDLANITMHRENDTLIVNVESVNLIERFKYNWQNSEQRSVPVESKSFTQEIILPSENNILTITLEDETGRAVTYTKEIILDGIDIAKPSISIDKQYSGLRINVTDETKIAYMTYKIDDGEEKRVDKNNEEDTAIEYAVGEEELGRGTHTIFVTAVDAAGNTNTEEQEVVISSERPTINNMYIDYEQGKLIIEASDADGLASIEVNLNGTVYNMPNLDRTEAAFSLDLIEGTNTISIKLTNVNGITSEGATEFEYAR